MKIAIVTWFDNQNYGTVLQALSLKTYLEAHFGSVNIVNYVPETSHMLKKSKTVFDYPVRRITEKIKKTIGNKDDAFFNEISERFNDELKTKRQRFNDFISSRLGLTEKIETDAQLKALCEEYDLFVCGSDQIWNPRNMNDVFYLSFVESKPKVSYSASFGINYFPKYSKAIISDYLNDFRGVSLREATLKAELEKLSGKDVSVCCDPCFLTDRGSWEKEAEKSALTKKGYYLNYYLGNSAYHEKIYNKVGGILNKECVALPSSAEGLQRSSKEAVSAGPYDFLYLVKNADYVLTDSFHAICFSIIFHIPFCAVLKHDPDDPFNQNSRVLYLLERLGLSDRIAYNENDAEAILKMPADFSKSDALLEEFIEQSEKYLDDNIY